MANIPTPEDAAAYILEIYAGLNHWAVNLTAKSVLARSRSLQGGGRARGTQLSYAVLETSLARFGLPGWDDICCSTRLG